MQQKPYGIAFPAIATIVVGIIGMLVSGLKPNPVTPIPQPTPVVVPTPTPAPTPGPTPQPDILALIQQIAELLKQLQVNQSQIAALEAQVAELSKPANRVETPDTPPAPEGSNPQPGQAVPPTMRELSDFANQYARSGMKFAADVEPRNQVWNHLMQDHGFDFGQVDGMTYNAALWLHAAAHAGHVTPQGINWTAPAAQPARQQPTAVYSGNCANGQCHQHSYRRGFLGLFDDD